MAPDQETTINSIHPASSIQNPEFRIAMEVHAHAHTERKKWNHYLWEFLMLFLAVTLGFWAENLREERKLSLIHI